MLATVPVNRFSSNLLGKYNLQWWGGEECSDFEKKWKKGWRCFGQNKISTLYLGILEKRKLSCKSFFIDITNYQKWLFNIHPPPTQKNKSISCFRKVVNGSFYNYIFYNISSTNRPSNYYKNVLHILLQWSVVTNDIF